MNDVSMNEMAAARIAAVFNRQFADSYRTVMVGGSVEPLYLPVRGSEPALVAYTRDYPASALHEAAHWCLAGPSRRQRRDYGYWYVPGPRNAEQRRAFFAAELDVQALEAEFARVAGVKFVVSADDFDAPVRELEAFVRSVCERSAVLRRQLPRRAAQMRAALAAEIGTGGG
jgi:elongation factor P hydroxylase